ncbi:hypothetical protein EVAR_90559_1 [Eumeta japonica]|uniref:Uncharacterized protein n=1 Tax=Eumeta variegata TaxID=151549 RepID=A0A4C1YQG4_EUMVA|nr:hypothetical protein EVAR_90559_1 [Eumeta japonica]
MCFACNGYSSRSGEATNTDEDPYLAGPFRRPIAYRSAPGPQLPLMSSTFDKAVSRMKWYFDIGPLFSLRIPYVGRRRGEERPTLI